MHFVLALKIEQRCEDFFCLSHREAFFLERLDDLVLARDVLAKRT